MKLKDLKKGELFAFKRFPKSVKEIYVRDEYERTTRSYWVYKYCVANSNKLVKGNVEVYNDFTEIDDEVPY